jgi:hypothetical protein
VDLPLRGGADIPNGGGGTTGQRWRSPLCGHMQWARGVPGLHSGGRDDTASTWLGRVSRCGVLRRSAGRGHGVLVESPPPLCGRVALLLWMVLPRGRHRGRCIVVVPLDAYSLVLVFVLPHAVLCYCYTISTPFLIQ